MPKLLSCLLLWLAAAITHAQVINSFSPDKTGFYEHAPNTLHEEIKLIR